MLTLSDLRHRPDFRAVVADRLWTAWWQAAGSSLDEVAAKVGESLGPARVPTSFVAHDGDRFRGTASLIAADLPLRPQYTPWLAAVWVEPDARLRGVGRALVARVSVAAFEGGFDRLYLYCDRDKISFYAGLGWRVMEEDVGPARVAVLDQSRPQLGTLPRP